LKRPIRASCNRRSRLRRWRSCSSHPSNDATQSVATTIEQTHQTGGDGTEVGAAFRGAQQQLLASRGNVGETVGGAMLARGALVRDQGLDMFSLLDLCPFVVTAGMTGQHMCTIDASAQRRVQAAGC
jgi:hypothetical protein